MTRPTLITSDDAAAYVGCSTKTLGRIRRAGGIRHYLVAGKVKYSYADCDAYLDSCRVDVQPNPAPAGVGRRTARVIPMRRGFSEVHG